MAEYECVLCTKNEAFVYQIPARTSNRGYRAADWKLDEPDWTGRLRVASKGNRLIIKLEDTTTGELFAQCPVDAYPSAAVEQVLDSSRYFVIRIQDGSGRCAFIGLGFSDRGDSFDLLVTIQDHFKRVNRDVKADVEQTESEATVHDQSAAEPEPKLDLAFKEGQTIKINITTKKSSGESSGASRPRSKGAGGTSPFLPPPPSPSRHSASNIEAGTETKCESGIAQLSLGVKPKTSSDGDWVSFD